VVWAGVGPRPPVGCACSKEVNAVGVVRFLRGMLRQNTEE